MALKSATIDRKAGTLTIVMELQNPPEASSTGKTLMVASTRGNVTTDVVVDGQKVKVGANAYIMNKVVTEAGDE